MISRMRLRALVLGVSLTASSAAAQEAITEVDLPEPVAKTFRTVFPEAEIQKLTAELENGVMVYDFEFRNGDVEKETDIAADGTMMEETLVVDEPAIPAPVMKSIKSAAKNAKIGRLEHIDVEYTTEDGKVVKLPKRTIRYAAELHKGDQMAEVVVGADGKVIDKPEWVAKAPTSTAPGK